MAEEKSDKVAELVSYSSINPDEYDLFGGEAGAKFQQVMYENGGYRKWFASNATNLIRSTLTEVSKLDGIKDKDKAVTMGVTFGGAFKERLKDPLAYEYNYDIMLRLVRGEKLFIKGFLSSHEYLFNLFVRNSKFTEKLYDDVATIVLKQFEVVEFANSQDASIYARRSNKDSNQSDAKQAEQSEKLADKSGFDHRVCNRDKSDEASMGPLLEALQIIRNPDKNASAEQKGVIEKAKESVGSRINTGSGKYSVKLLFGIPGDEDLAQWAKEKVDVAVVFAKDDKFEYQATYLRNETFSDADEMERVYRELYKYPRSAAKVFGGNDKIPTRPNKSQFLSVLSTVSSTKTTQVGS